VSVDKTINIEECLEKLQDRIDHCSDDVACGILRTICEVIKRIEKSLVPPNYIIDGILRFLGATIGIAPSEEGSVTIQCARIDISLIDTKSIRKK